MSIEIILGECVANFSVGVGLGYSIERRLGPKIELSAYLSQLCSRDQGGTVYLIDDKENDVYKGKAKHTFNSIALKTRIAYGCMAALANDFILRHAIPDINPFTVMAAGGVSMYLGVRFGEYLSKKSRRKAKLTDDEKNKFYELMEKTGYVPKNSDEDLKQNVALSTDYIQCLVDAKKNVEIVRPLIQKFREQIFISSILKKVSEQVK